MSWVLKLQKQMQKKGDDIPPGWKSSEQIAKELNLSHGSATRITREWLAAGVVQMKVFKVLNKGMFLRPTRFYKAKK